MSIVTLPEVKTFLGIAATDDSEDDILEFIHDGIEGWAKNVKCHRTFDSTTYTNDLYDGTGETYLYLREYPITAITRIAINREYAIKIKNTSTDCTTAYAGVTSTTLDLVVSGGTNNGTSSLTFVTNTTLTLIVAAINALGKGWSAELYDSDYGSIKSTELLETFAKYCGGRANTTAVWEYLEMAGEPISNFKVYKDMGEIYYSGGFPEGEENVIISHTAGYSSTTMPDDLKKATLISVKFLYQQWKEERFGVTGFNLSGFMSQTLESGELPKIALAIFDRYAKVVIA